MAKHLFVVNPTAGRRDISPEIIPEIHARMALRGEPYCIESTRHPGHATELVRDHVADGEAWRVYVFGGDGTLSEAMRGLAGRENAALAHFPCGTGNDFVRLFGADAARFRDLDALLDGGTATVDLIRAGDRLALNIASVGLDARIAADLHRFRRLPMPYILSVMYNFFRRIHRAYEVTVDGVRQPGRFTILAAANGRWYGAGFHAAPNADPGDGLLDFILVPAVSRLTLLRLLPQYAKGRGPEIPLITYLRGRRMDIVCLDGADAVNLDGETRLADRAGFSVAEERMQLIIPRGCSWVSNEKTKDFPQKQEMNEATGTYSSSI